MRMGRYGVASTEKRVMKMRSKEMDDMHMHGATGSAPY